MTGLNIKDSVQEEQTAQPCPFCTAVPDALPEAPRTFAGQRFWKVLCHQCGAIGPTQSTEAAAITAWNSRNDRNRRSALRRH
ncbi:conserved hypothetical protein [Candidatus Sulfopaludibacter sp. SbA4]|nr:conserved hypothetical protein [Candidatus Sulfopaludibacter sp. SbA4]